MTRDSRPQQRGAVGGSAVLAVALLMAVPAPVAAQNGNGWANNPHGEWRYLGADAGNTRYSPLDQISPQNFENLELVWLWRGDNFGPTVDNLLRSTPSYINGMLYTVAGQRRTVVAIDPATGETVWTYREPHTRRWERSPRKNYGKGVAHAVVGGRDVIFIQTPAFFLHAIDAETGLPLERWGKPVPIDGFPRSGVVDLMQDLGLDAEIDPYHGHPIEHQVITSSSPPIVVNGVVVVSNSHEQSYFQTHQDNIPGQILAYDAATGEFLWKFNVIPRPGEYGHETWTQGDQWRIAGDVSSWAPMSADGELGLVYVVTNGPTNDFYGGHRLGDGLFGTSIIALDTRTGERRWHFQTVKHDLWNYDVPTAPVLLDVAVDGREIPAIVVNTKQSFSYAFNRATGEPIWPIEDRPVPASRVPGEVAAPTQPFPTRPAPFEIQGLKEEYLIDYTPELRQRALDVLKDYDWGPIFNPPLHSDNDEGLIASVHCPGSNGGANIPGPTSADPETGIMYVSSGKGCTAPILRPCTEIDPTSDMRYCTVGPGGVPGIEGLPIFAPPYSTITAIDMNTGDHLFQIPNGDTPRRIREHPLLQGVDLPNTGQTSRAITMVTSTLLMTAEGLGGEPLLHAVDKRTGERLGTVELPAPGGYGMMTYMHEGKQYVVVQVAGAGVAGSLAALALP